VGVQSYDCNIGLVNMSRSGLWTTEDVVAAVDNGTGPGVLASMRWWELARSSSRTCASIGGEGRTHQHTTIHTLSFPFEYGWRLKSSTFTNCTRKEDIGRIWGDNGMGVTSIPQTSVSTGPPLKPDLLALPDLACSSIYNSLSPCGILLNID